MTSQMLRYFICILALMVAHLCIIVVGADSLRVGRCVDRISVGRGDFPYLFRPALGPTQPPLRWVPRLPGVNRPGLGVNHPPPSSTEVKERVELHLYSPSGPSWPVLGRTLLYLVQLCMTQLD